MLLPALPLCGRVGCRAVQRTATTRAATSTWTAQQRRAFVMGAQTWPRRGGPLPLRHAPGPAASSLRCCAFHRTALAAMPRRRSFFTSNVLMRPDDGGGSSSAKGPGAAAAQGLPPTSASSLAAAAKRKPRSAGAKHSLRRVAVIAQQQPGASASAAAAAPSAAAGRPVASAVDSATAAAAAAAPSTRETAQDSGAAAAASHRASAPLRHGALPRGEAASADAAEADDGSNVISAVCLAESFDMERVMAILEAQGFRLDPDGSGFESHEVVHARKWRHAPGGHGHGADAAGATAGAAEPEAGWREVDLFVFESGTLVGWGLPADDVDALATAHLVGAAADPFVGLRETETLEFRRDAARETSAMRGDVVVLGTRHEAAEGDRLATTRAQIAFSSGLARSTKLAVLERSFTDYFESTRRIPDMLAGRHKGAGLGDGLGHISQRFILQKTGELLSLRAQLNHYRELTDALPDIFWDARAELGLEGYYEQVGRALDVGVRIKTLNQKMDYAQEIATVLREISSERHGTRLEWIIIVLIAVEVVFELRRVYLDWHEERADKEAAAAAGRA